MYEQDESEMWGHMKSAKKDFFKVDDFRDLCTVLIRGIKREEDK